MDNNDWTFASAYSHALKSGNSTQMKAVEAAYIPYMRSNIFFFEKRSVQLIRRGDITGAAHSRQQVERKDDARIAGDVSLPVVIRTGTRMIVASSGELLFVPATSIVTTTERTFVITSENGRAHWLDVKKGPVSDEQISVRANSIPENSS